MFPIGNTTQDFIRFVPGTIIDDFFFFGFVGGIVGHMYYFFSMRGQNTHVSFWVALYGIIVSGLLGGLLAIVFDRSIEVSILVGLLNQVVFLAMTKAVIKGDFWKVFKEILIKLLTGGVGGKP